MVNKFVVSEYTNTITITINDDVNTQRFINKKVDSTIRPIISSRTNAFEVIYQYFVVPTILRISLEIEPHAVYFIPNITAKIENLYVLDGKKRWKFKCNCEFTEAKPKHYPEFIGDDDDRIRVRTVFSSKLMNPRDMFVGRK